MNCKTEIKYSKKDKLSKEKLNLIFELNQNNIPALGSLNNLKHVQDIYNNSLFLIEVIVEDDFAGFAFVMDNKSEYQSLNYRYFKNKFKNFLYIDRVAFIDKFQRRGYGTITYDEIHKLSKKLNSLLCCEVNTFPLNKESMDFHRKFGFSVIEEVPFGEKKVAMLCKY